MQRIVRGQRVFRAVVTQQRSNRLAVSVEGQPPSPGPFPRLVTGEGKSNFVPPKDGNFFHANVVVGIKVIVSAA